MFKRQVCPIELEAVSTVFHGIPQVWDNSSTYKLMYPTCLCISNPSLCQFFFSYCNGIYNRSYVKYLKFMLLYYMYLQTEAWYNCSVMCI